MEIIKEVDKIWKLPYDKKRPKNEPTESYFKLARHIEKCMMRSDNLNWYDHGGYKEMTAPYWNVNVTNKNKSKCSIVNKPFSQNFSAKDNKSCSTTKDKSECSNKKQKDAKNKVACDVTNYFNVSNVFECERNNPDVSCERACMATEDNEYFSDILDTLKEYQDRHGQRLCSKKLRSSYPHRG